MTVQTRKMTIRELRDDPEIRRAAKRVAFKGIKLWMPAKGRELIKIGVVPPIVFYDDGGGGIIPATAGYADYLRGLANTPWDDGALDQEITVYVLGSRESDDDALSFVNWVQHAVYGMPRERWRLFDPDERIDTDLTKPL